LGLGSVFGEKIEKEEVWFFALASGGFKEAAQDGVVFQSLVGASALDDPAHDDDGAQAPFGLIIGGGYSGVAEAGEEEFLFRTKQAQAQLLSYGITQGIAA
jgi:hypothetical protein